jgi:hypothetical protein
MADYYPALARAVSRLAKDDDPARQELYARARTIIVEQLRRLNPQKSAPEMLRECAALEAAIREVEAKSLSDRTHTPKRRAQPRLKVVVTHDSGDSEFRREDLSQDQVTALPAQVKPETIVTSKKPIKHAADDMAEIPELLGAMLIRTAFISGMLAIIGAIYIRGLILVSDKAIGYPVLLVAAAVMISLFIFLPLAIFRKARIVSGVGFLLALAYSASRHGI